MIGVIIGGAAILIGVVTIIAAYNDQLPALWAAVTGKGAAS